ncbi:MAG TPA: hypothetical protein VLA56_09585 [Pseudomonadales bacterium]|nr:hypothetical protein [Pseudomonadales bacterium]
MNRKLIIAVGIAATLPLAAGAVMSPRQERPLETCDSAVQSELDRAVIKDTFHNRRADGGHDLYFNVVQMENGAPVAKRVTCSTTATGRTVTDLRAEAGRWVEADRG